MKLKAVLSWALLGLCADSSGQDRHRLASNTSSVFHLMVRASSPRQSSQIRESSCDRQGCPEMGDGNMHRQDIKCYFSACLWFVDNANMDKELVASAQPL